MKDLSYLISLLLLSLYAKGAAAKPRCATGHGGIGGSEHSFGLPAELPAAAAFAASPEIMAQKIVLERHGYCAETLEPSVTLVSPACTPGAHYCSTRYEVMLRFSAAQGGAPRDVSGTYMANTGSKARFVAKPLVTVGFGATKVVSGADGETLMQALAESGVTDNTGLLGVGHLFAGEIQCSYAVVPHPVPGCTVTDGKESLVVSDATAAAVNDIFLRLGATLKTGAVGSGYTAASLVTCTRVVYPGALANCSFLIEK